MRLALLCIVLGFLCLAAIVLTNAGCLDEGPRGLSEYFTVKYSDRSAGAYVGEEGDGGAIVRGRCPLPLPERLTLERPCAGCTYVPRADGRGLNLLCGVPGEIRIAFTWQPHIEGGRGEIHQVAGDCAGDFLVDVHREVR